jgi:hypothetical protein
MHPATPGKQFASSFGRATFYQVALLLAAMLLAGLNLGFPIVVVLCLYAPTIFLTAMTGYFVGCSSMGWPLFLGVPLGIVTYSAIWSKFVCQTRRKNLLEKKESG